MSYIVTVQLGRIHHRPMRPNAAMVPRERRAPMNKTPVSESYLKYKGYSVGQQGPPFRKRCEILDYCYQHGIVHTSVFPELGT